MTLTLLLILRDCFPKMRIYYISWISSFAWSDDDSLDSKYVAMSIILCNKLLCLT